MTEQFATTPPPQKKKINNNKQNKKGSIYSQNVSFYFYDVFFGQVKKKSLRIYYSPIAM